MMEDTNERPENHKATHKNILKKRVKKTSIKRPVVATKKITKYPALSLISKIYAIFAWVSFFVSIPVIIFNAFQATTNIHWVMGVFTFLLGVVCCGLVFITLLAISEAIRVFIDIEENTRARS